MVAVTVVSEVKYTASTYIDNIINLYYVLYACCIGCNSILFDSDVLYYDLYDVRRTVCDQFDVTLPQSLKTNSIV